MPRISIHNLTTGHQTYSDTVTQQEANDIITAVSKSLDGRTDDHIRIEVLPDRPVNQTGQHAHDIDAYDAHETARFVDDGGNEFDVD